MNKEQYQHKLAIYVLLASSATLLATDSFAKSETPVTHAATAIDRVAASAKHKALNEKAQAIEGKATLIEVETQKAIISDEQTKFLAFSNEERSRLQDIPNTRTNR